jgi:hypothetical protein
VAQPILPFALPLVLCDGYDPAEAGKMDLFGCFHTIRPAAYPHLHEHFCVVAHLTGGLGSMTTFIDIRNLASGELVHWTFPHQFRIPDRQVLVRLAHRLEDVPFPQPGIYLIELYCENTPIADFRLRLAAREDAGTEVQT